MKPEHWWFTAPLRIKSFFRRDRVERELDEELQFHLDHKIEEGIAAEWKQTENNRRAKFYSLTRLGRKQLESETANWQRLSSAISHLVQLKEA